MDLEYQYLVARLQEALACDERVGSQDIKVVATAGRVHLIGDVSTEARRAAADEVARQLAQGVPVRNELNVLALGDAGKPEAIE
jgi:osmotically-inducible protein OsmY